MQMAHRVWQALIDLGKTDADVITSLLEAGYHGKRWDGEKCVFAEYIKGIFYPGEVVGVCVDNCRIHVYEPSRTTTMLTPENITLLMDDFDGGLIPSLVKD